MDMRVTIKSYHAENNIFKVYLWQQACKNEKLKLTFAGMNTYFTNGVAEKRIESYEI